MNKKPHFSDIPIFDLHCDLLGSIELNEGKYTFDSPETRCSIPQLLQGKVKLQVLAVAAINQEGSSAKGARQIELYEQLLKTYPQARPFKGFSLDSPALHFLLAIENASALLDEEESLDLFFERFERYRHVEEILYISLTWNDENRFGGGNKSNIGLKRDGELVLEYLDGKNIALDFSHTSDQLAYDLLNMIEKKSLKIPIMASHSNYRAVQDVPRNLPDDIAKEIISQNGVIGLNFVKRFVGKTPEAFLNHIEHGLSLGGEDAICLGADFYGGIDLQPGIYPGRRPVEPFFPSFSNSGCYPQFIELLRGKFSDDLIHKICFQNVEKFLSSLPKE